MNVSSKCPAFHGDIAAYILNCLSGRDDIESLTERYEILAKKSPCVIDRENKTAFVFSAELAHKIFDSNAFHRSVRLRLMGDVVDLDSKYEMYLHYNDMPVFAEEKKYSAEVEKKFMKRTQEIWPRIEKRLILAVSQEFGDETDFGTVILNALSDTVTYYFEDVYAGENGPLANHALHYMRAVSDTAYDDEFERAKQAIEVFKRVSENMTKSSDWFSGQELDPRAISPIVAQWAAGFAVPLHAHLMRVFLQEFQRSGGEIVLEDNSRVTAIDGSSDGREFSSLIPFQFANRDCVYGTKIDNFRFETGMRVFVFLGVANWDEAKDGKSKLFFGPVNRPCAGMRVSILAEKCVTKQLKLRLRDIVAEFPLVYSKFLSPKAIIGFRSVQLRSSNIGDR